MKRSDVKFWIDYEYPLTIISDRYGGTYSKAQIIAFPLDYYDIPVEVSGEDMECAWFWGSYKEPVGKGMTPDEALADLRVKMKKLV